VYWKADQTPLVAWVTPDTQVLAPAVGEVVRLGRIVLVPWDDMDEHARKPWATYVLTPSHNGWLRVAGGDLTYARTLRDYFYGIYGDWGRSDPFIATLNITHTCLLELDSKIVRDIPPSAIDPDAYHALVITAIHAHQPELYRYLVVTAVDHRLQMHPWAWMHTELSKEVNRWARARLDSNEAQETYRRIGAGPRDEDTDEDEKDRVKARLSLRRVRALETEVRLAAERFTLGAEAMYLEGWQDHVGDTAQACRIEEIPLAAEHRARVAAAAEIDDDDEDDNNTMSV
jgi:hypothetical protein